MSNTVKRPDLRKPDQYLMELDETMLLLIEDGLLKKAGELQALLDQHYDCNLANDRGCGVRHTWLVTTYGSLDEAANAGYYQTDCSEDLAFLHGHMAKIHDQLFQSRYVRTRPDSYGLHAQRDAEEKLNGIKGEIAHRTVVAKDDTGLMEKVTDEGPALEGEVVHPFQTSSPQQAQEGSLLGLKEGIKAATQKVRDGK